MTFILHTSGPVLLGSTVLGGITNLNSALGSVVRGEPTSGEIFARVMAILAQRPTVDFTTEDIALALATIGPMGASLGAGNLSIFGSRLVLGGSIDSASDHVALSAALGLIYPTTLTCSHQGNAQISYRADVVSTDGQTQPWTLSTGSALPLVTRANLYTLASATIGGVAVPQQVQLNVDFGIRVLTESGSSHPLPEIASLRAVLPTISITGSRQAAYFSNLYGASGVFSIVLQQRAQGGLFDSGSVTLSGVCLGMQETIFRAAGQGAAQVGLIGHVEYDGTHAPIVCTAV